MHGVAEDAVREGLPDPVPARRLDEPDLARALGSTAYTERLRPFVEATR